MTDVDLANALAVEVLGWTLDKKGGWWHGGSHTGLRAADLSKDVEHLGYFRPDRCWLHCQLCIAALEGRGGGATIGWPGGRRFRVEARAGEYAHLIEDSVDEVLDGSIIYAAASATLEAWRADRNDPSDRLNEMHVLSWHDARRRIDDAARKSFVRLSSEDVEVLAWSVVGKS